MVKLDNKRKLLLVFIFIGAVSLFITNLPQPQVSPTPPATPTAVTPPPAAPAAVPAPAPAAPIKPVAVPTLPPAVVPVTPVIVPVVPPAAVPAAIEQPLPTIEPVAVPKIPTPEPVTPVAALESPTALVVPAIVPLKLPTAPSSAPTTSPIEQPQQKEDPLANMPIYKQPINYNANDELSTSFSRTITGLSDSGTGISPSHLGHPGFKHLTFLYDVAINAMMLKLSGHQKQAERIMDYFARSLNTPLSQIQEQVDSNDVLGVVKVMSSDDKTLGLVNAFDLQSIQKLGHGQLEYYTTPGPVSFMTLAFLQINKNKYLPEAIKLGKALLSMQHANGGIYDGDRAKSRVYTEPHLDAANAFFQLYSITKDEKWKIACEKAIAWFENNVYEPQSGEIYQGMWEYGPNKIFATDVYSWTMDGFMGDVLSIRELEALTDTLLKRSLSQVTLELPGGVRQTIVMVDFTDSLDPDVIEKRKGFHPMGSPEWTGGVILALQKNAVRLWEHGYLHKARIYKAAAEFLSNEVLKARYKVDGMTMFPYATGQGIEVGHGWKTPYFYVKDPASPVLGGSLVGGWPIMPMNGFNPFILNDPYFATYQKIDVSDTTRKMVANFITLRAARRKYVEPVLVRVIDKKTQIIEPGNYNTNAWNSFENKDYVRAIFWAKQVIENPKWVELADREEKIKMKRVGGIVRYPWGKIYKNNESPIHYEILRYPLLNEVGTSMWILANSYYELKDMDKAKYWVKRLIEELPLHQIPHLVGYYDVKNSTAIDGYWNALVSWVSNPYQSKRDQAIEALINDMNLRINVPREVDLDNVKPVSNFS